MSCSDLSNNNFEGTFNLDQPTVVYVSVGSNYIDGVNLTLRAVEVLDLSNNAIGSVDPAGDGNVGIVAPSLVTLSLEANNLVTWPAPSDWLGMNQLLTVTSDRANPVCQKGFYGDPDAGDLLCRICAANSYSDAFGALTCTPCAPNARCPAGSISPAACVKVSCVAVAGSVPDEANGNCNACPPGSHPDATGLACVPCSSGTFTSGAPGTVGLCAGSCPPGTYGARSGAASLSAGCSPCPVGSYNSDVGSPSVAACARCGIGRVAHAAGTTQCSLCAPGSFTTALGDCEQCPPGSYSDAVGALSCAGACAAGKYSANAGATDAHACTACPPGSVSAAGAGRCRACAGGSIAVTVAGCTPCGVGSADVCSPAAAFPYSAAALAALPAAFDGSVAPTPPSVDSTSAWAAFALAACALLACVAFMYGHTIQARLALYIDMFALQHLVRPGTAVVNRPTGRGAACTLAFIVLAAFIAVVLGVQFASNNVFVTSALVPVALRKGLMPLLVRDVVFTVHYRDWPGAATPCAQPEANLTLRLGGFVGTASSLASAAPSSSGVGCVLSWDLPNSFLASHPSLRLSQPAWLAQHFTWSLALASGLDSSSNSTLSGHVDASAATRVTGAVVVALEGTPACAVDTHGVTTSSGMTIASGGASMHTDDGSAVVGTDTVELVIQVTVCGCALRAECVDIFARVCGGVALRTRLSAVPIIHIQIQIQNILVTQVKPATSC